jgi:hypothetical protein
MNTKKDIYKAVICLEIIYRVIADWNLGQDGEDCYLYSTPKKRVCIRYRI